MAVSRLLVTITHETSTPQAMRIWVKQMLGPNATVELVQDNPPDSPPGSLAISWGEVVQTSPSEMSEAPGGVVISGREAGAAIRRERTHYYGDGCLPPHDVRNEE